MGQPAQRRPWRRLILAIWIVGSGVGFVLGQVVRTDRSDVSVAQTSRRSVSSASGALASAPRLLGASSAAPGPIRSGKSVGVHMSAQGWQLSTDRAVAGTVRLAPVAFNGGAATATEHSLVAPSVEQAMHTAPAGAPPASDTPVSASIGSTADRKDAPASTSAAAPSASTSAHSSAHTALHPSSGKKRASAHTSPPRQQTAASKRVPLTQAVKAPEKAQNVRAASPSRPQHAHKQGADKAHSAADATKAASPTQAPQSSAPSAPPKGHPGHKSAGGPKHARKH